MTNPWQLYDDILDLIPAGVRVTDALIGRWAFVRTDVGTGAAMVYAAGPKAPLADRDEVDITGSTLTNRSLPRLLKFCAHTSVILVGPSAPFAPEALPACVSVIAGSIVADPDHVHRALAMGGGMGEARPGLRQFNAAIQF